jgi:hypothetical protein
MACTLDIRQMKRSKKIAKQFYTKRRIQDERSLPIKPAARIVPRHTRYPINSSRSKKTEVSIGLTAKLKRNIKWIWNKEASTA